MNKYVKRKIKNSIIEFLDVTWDIIKILIIYITIISIVLCVYFYILYHAIKLIKGM